MAGSDELADACRTPLRAAFSAGEPLNPEVIHWVNDHLGCPVHDQCGQTKGGIVVANHHAIDHPRQPGSTGVPTPGIRAVIVDELPKTPSGKIRRHVLRERLSWPSPVPTSGAGQREPTRVEATACDPGTGSTRPCIAEAKERIEREGIDPPTMSHRAGPTGAMGVVVTGVLRCWESSRTAGWEDRTVTGVAWSGPNRVTAQTAGRRGRGSQRILTDRSTARTSWSVVTRVRSGAAGTGQFTLAGTQNHAHNRSSLRPTRSR